MLRYILGRLAGLLFTFFIVSVITFSLMHAVPGGPFDENKQPLPPAAKANILHKYGLDKPVWQQYVLYMWAALHFDFGIPYQSPTETVQGLVARVWPATLQLAGVVILFSYTLACSSGPWRPSGRTRGSITRSRERQRWDSRFPTSSSVSG
ncbi:MAG: hypothetical protein ACLQDL_04670 [Spirochaetia bacterium]